MAVNFDYYEKFKDVTNHYMPTKGEGHNMATQIVTAVNRLVYRWYDFGDVFDNVHSQMAGWVHDISSYANWLASYTDAKPILRKVCDCTCDDDYDELLKELADHLLDEAYLAKMATGGKKGTIYRCKGSFRWEAPANQ